MPIGLGLFGGKNLLCSAALEPAWGNKLADLRAWEETVYVACSTLCFARYPLDRALRIIGELEFSKVDVAIHEKGPHLRPSEVAQDVTLATQRIRIGTRLSPSAFSVEIEAEGEAFIR